MIMKLGSSQVQITRFMPIAQSISCVTTLTIKTVEVCKSPKNLLDCTERHIKSQIMFIQYWGCSFT